MISKCSLAQVNISRMRARLDSPVMAGFVGRLDEINAVADASHGFVWRLKAESGNATYLQPYDDPRIIMNLSVWDSIESLRQYAYRSSHVQLIRDRENWFERIELAYLALWWIPVGHIPTIEEAKERLQHLRVHGESPAAFSFKRPFPPAAVSIGAAEPPEIPPGAISYDKRVFRLKSNASEGDCDPDTVFHYHQRGQRVWATYDGRGSRMGALLATADEAGCLDSIYQHLNSKGEFRVGQCRTVPELISDGRLLLHESWKWVGSTQPELHTVLEELAPGQI